MGNRHHELGALPPLFLDAPMCSFLNIWYGCILIFGKRDFDFVVMCLVATMTGVLRSLQSGFIFRSSNVIAL